MQSLLQEACMSGLINESRYSLNGIKQVAPHHAWTQQQCHSSNSEVQVSGPRPRSTEVQGNGTSVEEEQMVLPVVPNTSLPVGASL